MKICVAGLGKVGLPIACYFVSLGHRVRGHDVNADLVQRIREQISPLPYEPGVTLSGLQVSDQLPDVLFGMEVAYVIVPTPQEGAALSAKWVEQAVASLRGEWDGLIIVGSTLMPDDANRICDGVSVVYNPPLIRLGHVIEDLREARVALVGATYPRAKERLRALWGWGPEVRVVEGDPRSVALAKLAINVSLSLRIAWANELSTVCQKVGASADVVLQAVGADPRIGGAYLRPGFPPGGPCLPRDLEVWRGLSHAPIADRVFFSHAEQGRAQVTRLVNGLTRIALRPRVAVLGATYNPGALDVTGSRGLAVAEEVLRRGWSVVLYDPAGPWLPAGWAGKVPVVDSVEEALVQAEVVVIATPWPEFDGLEVGGRPVVRCDR